MYSLSFPKSILLVLLCVGCLTVPAWCQIGIDQDQPHPTSVLDIKGTAKGLLIPRMTAAERLTITVGQPEGQKANSLIVFDSTYQRYFFYDKYLRRDWLSLFPTLHLTTGNPEVYAGDIFEGKLGIGTALAPQERLEVAGNVKADKFIGDGIIPTGGIIMWSGAVDAIPAGWALCDGQNNRPDLRNRFIVGAGGAGATYAPHATGGTQTVTLTVSQLPGHTHGPGTLNIVGSGGHTHSTNAPIKNVKAVGINSGGGENAQNPDIGDATTTAGGGTHTHPASTFAGLTASTGSGAAIENRPPYYALAFIIKL
jgi:microcystin-dependent protein